VRRNHRVQFALHHPRFDDTAPTFEVHLQHPVHPRDVEGEAGGGRLPGQGSAAAARGYREVEVPGGGEGSLNVLL
jgi:hypothetical protein